MRLSLRSVGRLKRQMAEICVKAVMAVADLERKDVNMDLIKVRWMPTDNSGTRFDRNRRGVPSRQIRARRLLMRRMTLEHTISDDLSKTAGVCQ